MVSFFALDEFLVRFGEVGVFACQALDGGMRRGGVEAGGLHLLFRLDLAAAIGRFLPSLDFLLGRGDVAGGQVAAQGQQFGGGFVSGDFFVKGLYFGTPLPCAGRGAGPCAARSMGPARRPGPGPGVVRPIGQTAPWRRWTTWVYRRGGSRGAWVRPPIRPSGAMFIQFTLLFGN